MYPAKKKNRSHDRGGAFDITKREEREKRRGGVVRGDAWKGKKSKKGVQPNNH